MTWHDKMTASERRKWDKLERQALGHRDGLKDVRSEQEKIRQAVLYRVRKAAAKENGDE